MLLLDGLERQVLADRQAAVTLRAGGFEVEIPSFTEERAVFDAALVAEPAPPVAMTEQMELRQALGVA